MLPTKDRIIAAATKLLDAGGTSAVTLRAVGDAAGISQSAPYRHFPDKRALLDAIVRQTIQQIRDGVDLAKSEAESPLSALNLVVGQYYRFARRYPVRYRMLLEESRHDTAVGAESRQVFTTVADLVQDAQRSKEIWAGDPGQIVALIFGAVHGMADLEQFGLVKGAAEEETTALPSLLVEMLSRQAHAAYA
jgi:AcrR family transcriptional regulator